MKAITIVNRIKKENSCSIHTAELLTNALIREASLPDGLSVRFRPLFGDFDIVTTDYIKGLSNHSFDYFYIGSDPDKIIPVAQFVMDSYCL